MNEENEKRPSDAIKAPTPHAGQPSDQIMIDNGRVAPLSRTSSASAAQAALEKQPPHEHKDGLREVVETIVFVVVLVLLLKTFLAEAFVIPTGSMAETLFGYHKEVICPECGWRFPVNFSSQADPQDNPAVDVTGCECPNCERDIPFQRIRP